MSGCRPGQAEVFARYRARTGSGAKQGQRARPAPMAHAVMNAARPKAALGDLNSSGAQNDVFNRQADIRKAEFAVAGGLVQVMEHRQHMRSIVRPGLSSGQITMACRWCGSASSCSGP